MMGLSGDKVYQQSGTLSGGEKTKLALAMLMVGRNNLLLLDEPTNNLDPPSRESVADALQRLEGQHRLRQPRHRVRRAAVAHQGAAACPTARSTTSTRTGSNSSRSPDADVYGVAVHAHRNHEQRHQRRHHRRHRRRGACRQGVGGAHVLVVADLRPRRTHRAGHRRPRGARHRARHRRRAHLPAAPVGDGPAGAQHHRRHQQPRRRRAVPGHRPVAPDRRREHVGPVVRQAGAPPPRVPVGADAAARGAAGAVPGRGVPRAGRARRGRQQPPVGGGGRARAADAAGHRHAGRRHQHVVRGPEDARRAHHPDAAPGGRRRRAARAAGGVRAADRRHRRRRRRPQAGRRRSSPCTTRCPATRR